MVLAMRSSARTKTQSKGKESDLSQTRRKLWTDEEDAVLHELFGLHGPKNWPLIARELSKRCPKVTRSGKSCRLRWMNQLDPSINWKPWTDEERGKIVDLHSKLGSKWAAIAKEMSSEELGCRTDNMVKNLWNSSLKHDAKKSHSPAPSTSTSSEEGAEFSSNGLSVAQTTPDFFGSTEPYGYPRKVTVRPPDLWSGIDRVASPRPSYAGNLSFPNLGSPPQQLQHPMQNNSVGLAPLQASSQSMFAAPPVEFYGVPAGNSVDFDDLLSSLRANHDEGVMKAIADADLHSGEPGAYYPTYNATPGSAAGLASPPYSHGASYVPGIDELTGFSHLPRDMIEAEGATLSHLLSSPPEGDLAGLPHAYGPWYGDALSCDPSTPPHPTVEEGFGGGRARKAPYGASRANYSPDPCQTGWL